MIKNAQTAIKRKPNAASICRRFTIGENILIQNSQPRVLQIRSESLFNIRVFHTENEICITNIPIDVQMILDFHFLTLSSSFDENRSLIIPIIKNITAIPIKKFLIWKAIVVNTPIIPSDQPSPGVKKNHLTGLTKESRVSLLLPVSPTTTVLTLLSTVFAADTNPILKNREANRRIIRIIISVKKWFIPVYRNEIKNANILALICLSSLFFYNPFMRIWFFGTPSLSASVLQDLIDISDIEVVFVVTNPDKSIGRSGELQPTPVNALATIHDIPVLTPTRIRDNVDFLRDLRTYDCDYFVVVAYGKIVPQELLDIPKKMCINVHGSILPLYRGASPIQAALLNWEKETGVTIMEMSLGMDEGDILKIRTISIDSNETSATLFSKFAEISGPTLIQTLRELEIWWITPLPQDPNLATYCKKIEKEDGLIDWSQSASSLYHRWQAYTPWPGIYTKYEGKRLLLEIVKHEVWSTKNGVAGQVMRLEDGSIGIICGEWILTLWQVKLEWKKSQSIKDFLNGNQKFISYIF